MNGIMNTGVKAIAACLSGIAAPISIPNPVVDIVNKIAINQKRMITSADPSLSWSPKKVIKVKIDGKIIKPGSSLKIDGKTIKPGSSLKILAKK
eukprot:CAMPEP_0205817568 /NCGR_PEP_ID=MMETSP0205-20121125/24535_1 /ASSEMBLY_ACC=CAM_ASM_000278 /TAXON_ID=36767 /ORGANISM="Euplotes focardii, Strain TN1" /LENGTH=93 /DNA_ID=CAMNT_0053108403 /DNA_START=249 /DNA_END=530 /DNA_ORIENTATION=+